MRRLAIPAALIAAATLIPTPAHADNPYPTGDLSTLPACEWNYYRVMSIGEGLAHRLGDTQAELDRVADDYNRVVSIGEGLAHQLGDVTHERDELQADNAAKDALIERQADRIARKDARIERLVARLRGAR